MPMPILHRDAAALAHPNEEPTANYVQLRRYRVHPARNPAAGTLVPASLCDLRLDPAAPPRMGADWVSE